jgi:hypothetical protein
MAPRLPQKRRAGDEDSPARNNKRGGKNKREVTYDTYEEAMDGTSVSHILPRFYGQDRTSRTDLAGGVEYEEKGERYRDGDRVCLLQTLWTAASADKVGSAEL